jgi:hypothetical protein
MSDKLHLVKNLKLSNALHKLSKEMDESNLSPEEEARASELINEIESIFDQAENEKKEL